MDTDSKQKIAQLGKKIIELKNEFASYNSNLNLRLIAVDFLVFSFDI